MDHFVLLDGKNPNFLGILSKLYGVDTLMDGWLDRQIDG